MNIISDRAKDSKVFYASETEIPCLYLIFRIDQVEVLVSNKNGKFF